MEKELTHELIIVITNQGYTDKVMDAARSAGAGGGTAIHAKGTGAELARKFFGVSIASEKEIVFIISFLVLKFYLDNGLFFFFPFIYYPHNDIFLFKCIFMKISY